MIGGDPGGVRPARVIGAWALYGVGVLLGRERTRWLMGKLPLVRTEDIERTEAFFDRRGMWTVFFGRMIPIFRSLISIPAGVTRMAFWKFTALTTAGSAIWNTVLIYAGYALGSNWTKVEGYISVFTKIVIVLVVLAPHRVGCTSSAGESQRQECRRLRVSVQDVGIDSTGYCNSPHSSIIRRQRRFSAVE